MKKLMITAMKTRRSVRSYADKDMPLGSGTKIKEFAHTLTTPFGTKPRIEYVEFADYPRNKRLSTYGVIKNPKYFLVGITGRESGCAEDLGYLFEGVVLCATAYGFGTCWLGGTFNKGAFADRVGLNVDETLPVIAPVGYASDKKPLTAKLMGLATSSKKRKPFEELFYKDHWHQSANAKEVGDFAVPLEMVRLAPSAMNAQPWRVLVEGDKRVHFYRAGHRHLNQVDMGIGLCHFELAAGELELSGGYVHAEPTLMAPEGFVYTLTWERQ